MDSFYVAQIVGVVGFVFCMTGFLQQDDNRLKILVATGALTIAVHFYIMGALVASFSAGVSASRYFFASKRFLKHKNQIMPIFVVLYVAIAYWGYIDISDIIPATAGIIGTVSVFYLRHIPLRIGVILTAVFWLMNNIIKFSIGGIALETMNIIVNLITINRLRKIRKVE